jgi:hypothetical protein
MSCCRDNSRIRIFLQITLIFTAVYVKAQTTQVESGLPFKLSVKYWLMRNAEDYVTSKLDTHLLFKYMYALTTCRLTTIWLVYCSRLTATVQLVRFLRLFRPDVTLLLLDSEDLSEELSQDPCHYWQSTCKRSNNSPRLFRSLHGYLCQVSYCAVNMRPIEVIVDLCS